MLEGSVRKAGNRLRINAQLINTDDGYHLWSERYDRDMDDVFEVQDDIARTVVEKLKVKLLGATDAPLVKRPTRSMDAYHLYLRGHQAWQRATRDGYATAVEYLHRALSEDPHYAPGVRRAVNLLRLVCLRGPLSPGEAYPKVRAAAQKALDIDPTLAEAHTALGMASFFNAWDWEPAERYLQQAVTCNRATCGAHHVRALADRAGPSRRRDCARDQGAGARPGLGRDRLLVRRYLVHSPPVRPGHRPVGADPRPQSEPCGHVMVPRNGVSAKGPPQKAIDYLERG